MRMVTLLMRCMMVTVFTSLLQAMKSGSGSCEKRWRECNKALRSHSEQLQGTVGIRTVGEGAAGIDVTQQIKNRTEGQETRRTPALPGNNARGGMTAGREAAGGSFPGEPLYG